MSSTSPTHAQMSAIGFAALTIGRLFEQLNSANITLTPAQQEEITHTVSLWLRERYGNDVVESAKKALGSDPEDHDASDEEIDAAVEAVRTSLSLLLGKLAQETANTHSLDVEKLTSELKLALTEAYDDSEVEKRWSEAQTK